MVKEKIKKSIRVGPVWFLNKLLESEIRKMLFVCGHMRSGSSLLLHILNTNPEILGFGEMHIKYHSEQDFGNAVFNCYKSYRQLPSQEYYILDKILHTRLLQNQILLNKAKTIFLIREPGQAMSSMMKLDINMTSDNPEGAFNYYMERLQWISRAAEVLNPNTWTYTTYKELTNHPSVAFTKLRNLLRLENSLSGDYDVIWSTGKAGLGDSGSNIHAGEIKKKPKIEIDERILPYLERAQFEYDLCLNKLTDNNIF